MNCSQPRQFVFVEALHVVVVKKSVFTCSVYAFATEDPALATGPLSLVTFVSVSNEPVADEM
jgi:hypothetical protein